MTRIEIRVEAIAEIEEAAVWYGRQQAVLRGEFLAAVTEVMTAIAENPRQFRVLHRNTRRAFLRRFPFGVYFRVIQDRVLVVAFLHVRRDPSLWRVREGAASYWSEARAA